MAKGPARSSDFFCEACKKTFANRGTLNRHLLDPKRCGVDKNVVEVVNRFGKRAAREEQEARNRSSEYDITLELDEEIPRQVKRFHPNPDAASDRYHDGEDQSEADAARSCSSPLIVS